jgi:hypothetical protein
MAETTQAPAQVFCTAKLNFVARDVQLMGESVAIDIHDARVADLPGWETCGF